LFLVQQFSASVAPLISRSKYTKPLLCQGFFVFGTAVLSERRTAGFPRQTPESLSSPRFSYSQSLPVVFTLREKRIPHYRLTGPKGT